MTLTPVQIRREVLTPLVDFTTGHGLEIGPLAAPLVTSSMGDVSYVDVQPRSELVAHFALDPNVDCDAIPDLDYWLSSEHGIRSLSEAVAEGAPFDWVVASHVVEHVPDVIGWLADISAVLTEEGRLALVVPDRRYSFDVLRPQTTVGQALEAHERLDRTPSVRAVYDHFRSIVSVGADRVWAGYVPSTEERIHPVSDVLGVLEAARAGTYIDSHVWTHTPTSFVELVDELEILGLSDLVVSEVGPTRRDELDFFVVLERVPRAMTETGREEWRRGRAARVRARLALDGALVRADELHEAEEREELRSRVEELEGELDRLRREHHAVKASRRWWVGGVVTTPAALLRRHLPRRGP